MELGMMLRTIGFILACFPSAFFAVVFMGDSHQDNVPIVFVPVIIAIFPLLAARTRIARFAAWLSGLVLFSFSGSPREFDRTRILGRFFLRPQIRF